MKEEYERIINFNSPHSKKRKRMSLSERSAQFTPFAALSGYEKAISETARLTEQRRELSEEEIEAINLALVGIASSLPCEALLSYFVEDGKKEGGKYLKSRVRLKEINEVEGYILTHSRERIYFSDISSCILLS